MLHNERKHIGPDSANGCFSALFKAFTLYNNMIFTRTSSFNMVLMKMVEHHSGMILSYNKLPIISMVKWSLMPIIISSTHIQIKIKKDKKLLSSNFSFGCSFNVWKEINESIYCILQSSWDNVQLYL